MVVARKILIVILAISIGCAVISSYGVMTGSCTTEFIDCSNVIQSRLFMLISVIFAFILIKNNYRKISIALMIFGFIICYRYIYSAIKYAYLGDEAAFLAALSLGAILISEIFLVLIPPPCPRP